MLVSVPDVGVGSIKSQVGSAAGVLPWGGSVQILSGCVRCPHGIHGLVGKSDMKQ